MLVTSIARRAKQEGKKLTKSSVFRFPVEKCLNKESFQNALAISAAVSYPKGPFLNRKD